jgi:UDP-glucuronate 4-epimerase
VRERILVTGAAGFIGSHVAERLLQRGAAVVGVDNFDPFYPPHEKRRNLARAIANRRFRLVEADCADLDALDGRLGDAAFDVVVHLAAKAGVRPSIRDALGYARANVTGTAALLELARRRGIGRFVFGSSSSVYGNSRTIPFVETDPVERQISPYAATKRVGEIMCQPYHHLHGMTVMALRFFTVYGPRQRPDLAIRRFASRMMRGEEIPMYGDGTTERDYTWVDDIVDGTVAAIDWTETSPGRFEIVNLGGSRTTPLRRLIHLIAEALEVEPRIQHLPMQPGDVHRTWADVTKAGRLLGYHPKVTVEDGIPRFVAWLRGREAVAARAAAS